MKRKFAKALTCISILFLMMTGCGNAATANAEPDVLAESESEAAFMADSGQKVGTSAAADRVSDSAAAASTSSAESKSATEPKATVEPKTSADPKASAESKSVVESKSATESSSIATDSRQATESRQETDSKSVTGSASTPAASASTPAAPASTPAAPVSTPVAPASTPAAPASTPAAPASTPAASAPASSSTCNHNFTIQIHNENYDGCTGRNYSARVCSKCSYEEIIDDTGIVEVHSYGAGIWVSEPTCTESGEQYHVCSKCGKEEEHFFISPDPNNHDYAKSGETVMDPGCCNRQGIVQVTYSCTRCGDSYTQDEFSDYGDHCDSNGDGICDDCGTVCGEPVPEQPAPEQPSADGAQSVGE